VYFHVHSFFDRSFFDRYLLFFCHKIGQIQILINIKYQKTSLALRMREKGYVKTGGFYGYKEDFVFSVEKYRTLKRTF